ncbi:hypothetical protein B0H10DRAFT_1954416 [Mycena sp. CBHHK59/15]|nr:hypothetical protein B0H10DRAFT_1954416 [Mycena sp. CBHHK59/15]
MDEHLTTRRQQSLLTAHSRLHPAMYIQQLCFQHGNPCTDSSATQQQHDGEQKGTDERQKQQAGSGPGMLVSMCSKREDVITYGEGINCTGARLLLRTWDDMQGSLTPELPASMAAPTPTLALMDKIGGSRHTHLLEEIRLPPRAEGLMVGIPRHSISLPAGTRLPPTAPERSDVHYIGCKRCCTQAAKQPVSGWNVRAGWRTTYRMMEQHLLQAQAQGEIAWQGLRRASGAAFNCNQHVDGG